MSDDQTEGTVLSSSHVSSTHLTRMPSTSSSRSSSPDHLPEYSSSGEGRLEDERVHVLHRTPSPPRSFSPQHSPLDNKVYATDLSMPRKPRDIIKDSFAIRENFIREKLSRERLARENFIKRESLSKDETIRSREYDSESSSPIERSPPAHNNVPTKCSNFSISSILSRSEKSSSPPASEKSPRTTTPEKYERPPTLSSAYETLLKMDPNHMGAAAAFHPGLNPAFLERALPGGLPGKPAPWYPWFAAAASAYLPFPFDRKYSLIVI